jgi:RNA polymerase sigma-70 factor (ECF subfamily)
VPPLGQDRPGSDASADVMGRVGRGDEAAFADLYDNLAPAVFGVVRRVLRDPAQSEEVTQEVMVELWRLAPRYDPAKGSPRAWATTIAHRRAVDRVRAEQAARDRTERIAARASGDRDVVADEVETTWESARVRRALARLTDLQREAIELAYYGGHSYRDVAALLDVAEGTVKTRIRDGMIRLRDELGAFA